MTFRRLRRAFIPFAISVVSVMFGRHSCGQTEDASTTNVAVTPLAKTTAMDPLQVCVDSHDRARKALETRTLFAARAQLRSCNDPGCPIAIRAECGEWLNQAELEVPTVVLSATDDTRDLEDVRVDVDGKLLSNHFDGEPVELLPGPHTLTFELPDGRRKEMRIVVKIGEKNRVVHAHFLAPTPEAAAQPSKPIERRVRPSVNTKVAESKDHRALVLGILSAASAAMAGSFLFIGIDRRDKTNEQCAPICSDTEVSRVRRWFVLADIAGVTAVTTGGFGLYFYLDQQSNQRAKSPVIGWQGGF